MTRPIAGPTLTLGRSPRTPADDEVLLVLDAAWTPEPGSSDERVRSARDAADRVLRRFDPIEATSAVLDDWAAASGVVDALTIGSTSFWYYVRLRHWLWLQERVLWAAILAAEVDAVGAGRIRLEGEVDEPLAAVARALAAARGVELEAPPGSPAGAPGMAAPGPAAARRPSRWMALLGRAARRAVRAGRRWALRRRLARLAGDGGRLLVVLTQLPQRVDTPTGSRVMNPYLDPIADRLAGSALDPIVLDWRSAADGGGDDGHGGLARSATDRTLAIDTLRVLGPAADPAAPARAAAAAQRIAGATVPARTSGLDLGPELARHVADDAARWFGGAHTTVARLERLIETLGVGGVLVADEYHRQDCLEAAARRGVPVAAIQHGTIYRHHQGYIHRDRPAALHLADRTYVFGGWERDLLVRDSVYRPDEVVVGGSPRQELFRPATHDRDARRAALGVQPGERLIVLSGTYGSIYRRFHYPVVLARLFDRPLPGVRLVVKLHPAEPDEGPYRAVIEGVARAGGFEPPPIDIVQHVELYGLLAAGDAHLGIHSTVLTESVFVGTPNLLASGIEGGDLLDYVAAGVALPVSTGADLLAALDAAAAGAITAEAREAFLRRHYEPGSGSARIANDLAAWLAR